MKRLFIALAMFLALSCSAEEYLFGIEGAYLTARQPLGGIQLTLRGYRGFPVSLRAQARLLNQPHFDALYGFAVLYDSRTYPLGGYSGLAINYAPAEGAPAVQVIIGARYSPFELPGEVYVEWSPTFPRFETYSFVAGVALRMYSRGF